MGTKVITVDDIDGHDGEDVARRDFEIAGTTYAIDLGDANFKRLHQTLDELAPFLEMANEVRQATRARRNPADAAPRIQGYTNSDVRRWASEQGIEVSTRGKIADTVYEQFIATHPDAAVDA